MIAADKGEVRNKELSGGWKSIMTIGAAQRNAMQRFEQLS